MNTQPKIHGFIAAFLVCHAVSSLHAMKDPNVLVTFTSPAFGFSNPESHNEITRLLTVKTTIEEAKTSIQADLIDGIQKAHADLVSNPEQKQRLVAAYYVMSTLNTFRNGGYFLNSAERLEQCQSRVDQGYDSELRHAKANTFYLLSFGEIQPDEMTLANLLHSSQSSKQKIPSIVLSVKFPDHDTEETQPK